jgi:hypothetical protein
MKFGFPATFQFFDRNFEIHNLSMVYVMVISSFPIAKAEVSQFSAGPGA